MSKNQHRIETSPHSVVADAVGNRTDKSASCRRHVAAGMLAAAVALTMGGSSSALAKSPTFQTLYNFCSLSGCVDGTQPYAGLVPDKLGNLYGTTYAGGSGGAGTVFKLAPGGTLTTLHTFANDGTDGGNPYAGLNLDKAGNLYGTTSGGGAGNGGIVFKIAPDGAETVLHAFAGGSDGWFPIGVLLARKGDFYGTTYRGGNSDFGTVFKVAADGTETVLHAFLGGEDGRYPQSTLIAANAGNLYGTTSGGGANNFGTVFRVAPNGKEKVLYTFKGGSDGAYPVGGLNRDKAGNFYGTTSQGGADGFGTVFEIAPDGTETVLYSFKGGTDGAYPFANLIADRAGNFYGTTTQGGTGCSGGGCGTVFKLAPDGTETVLWALVAASDGQQPFFGALTTDSAYQKGAIFGTAVIGGLHGTGTIFRIKK